MLGRPLAVGAEMAVLLGGGRTDAFDALEEEAPALAAGKPEREERSLASVRDRPALPEHLLLLGVRADEVDDAVVGGLGVLEQRSEHADGLAGAGRRLHEERPAGPAESGYRLQQLALAGTDPVGEEGRDRGQRFRGHRR